MPDGIATSDHTPFILASYLISALALTGLAVWRWRRLRRARAAAAARA